MISVIAQANAQVTAQANAQVIAVFAQVISVVLLSTFQCCLVLCSEVAALVSIVG